LVYSTMSKMLRRAEGGAWLRLGAFVLFDGPDGNRLYGKIVRTSSNPTYFHVESGGDRYEVDLHEDNMRPAPSGRI